MEAKDTKVSNLAFLLNTYPNVSETFIERQIKIIGGKIIAKELNFESLDNAKEKKTETIAAFSLRIKENKSRVKFLRLKEKITSNISGQPFLYWNRIFESRLEKLIITEKIQSLLAHFGTNGINSAKICKKHNIDLSVHFHGYDCTALLRNKRYRNALFVASKTFRNIIVVNQEMKTDLVALGINTSKIHVIPYGINLKNYSKTLKNKAQNKPVQFLAVGRLVSKKDPLGLIKSFELCADQTKEVKLTIIGGGHLEKKVAQYVKCSRHNLRIKLLGVQQQSIVKNYLNESDIFVQHSVTDKDGNKEGWPNSIIEACAYSLPIISTRHAGIMDQVIHGETGFLVAEKDYKSMGEYMRILADNPKKRISMGQKAMLHISSICDIKQQTEKIIELISKK